METRVRTEYNPHQDGAAARRGQTGPGERPGCLHRQRQAAENTVNYALPRPSGEGPKRNDLQHCPEETHKPFEVKLD